MRQIMSHPENKPTNAIRVKQDGLIFSSGSNKMQQELPYLTVRKLPYLTVRKLPYLTVRKRSYHTSLWESVSRWERSALPKANLKLSMSGISLACRNCSCIILRSFPSDPDSSYCGNLSLYTNGCTLERYNIIIINIIIMITIIII